MVADSSKAKKPRVSISPPPTPYNDNVFLFLYRNSENILYFLINIQKRWLEK